MTTLLPFGLFLLVATVLIVLPLMILLLAALFLLRSRMRPEHLGTAPERTMHVAWRAARPPLVLAVTLLTLGVAITVPREAGLTGYWSTVRVALGFLIPGRGPHILFSVQWLLQLVALAVVAGLLMRRLERRFEAALRSDQAEGARAADSSSRGDGSRR